jgi:hypothetical protein
MTSFKRCFKVQITTTTTTTTTIKKGKRQGDQRRLQHLAQYGKPSMLATFSRGPEHRVHTKHSRCQFLLHEFRYCVEIGFWHLPHRGNTLFIHSSEQNKLSWWRQILSLGRPLQNAHVTQSLWNVLSFVFTPLSNTVW